MNDTLYAMPEEHWKGHTQPAEEETVLAFERDGLTPAHGFLMPELCFSI